MSRYKLTIDLDALAHNWHLLNGVCATSRCSAVVKADAYGLGAVQVTRRLYQEGCRDFFVATLSEAIELREALGEIPKIYVLTGIFPGEECACIDYNLVPTLVSLEMFERWLKTTTEVSAPSILKLDTGMGRLGLSVADLASLLGRPDCLSQAGVELVISHLACADTPEHPLNAKQLELFERLREEISGQYPDLEFSLANSAGCLLGREYHFDLVRLGVALYGGKVRKPDVFGGRSVASLSLSIIQLRQLSKGRSAGYGAEFVADKDSCLAVVSGGYADGIFRTLGNNSCVYIDGCKAPVVGRISMDSILVDVTGFALEPMSPETWPGVELLGKHQGVDDLASAAGTISYEILTSLGQRFQREYIGGGEE